MMIILTADFKRNDVDMYWETSQSIRVPKLVQIIPKYQNSLI